MFSVKCHLETHGKEFEDVNENIGAQFSESKVWGLLPSYNVDPIWGGGGFLLNRPQKATSLWGHRTKVMKPVNLKKLSEIRKKTVLNWKSQRFCSLWYVLKNKNDMTVGLGWLEGGRKLM